jgi:hypothetical protein
MEALRDRVEGARGADDCADQQCAEDRDDEATGALTTVSAGS